MRVVDGKEPTRREPKSGLLKCTVACRKAVAIKRAHSTHYSSAQESPAWQRAAQQRMGDFNAQELGNIAWAMAIATQWDALMFMSKALSNANWKFGVASITNELLEMSL